MYSKVARHCRLMSGSCANRKQTSVDNAGFLFFSTCHYGQLARVLCWQAIPLQSCWYVCSSHSGVLWPSGLPTPCPDVWGQLYRGSSRALQLHRQEDSGRKCHPYVWAGWTLDWLPPPLLRYGDWHEGAGSSGTLGLGEVDKLPRCECDRWAGGKPTF